MAAIFFAVFIVSFVVPLCVSAPPSQHQENLFREILRRRRQICPDGTYDVGGFDCCKCGAGQRVKQDCTNGKNNGICEPCEEGTYNSVANNQKTCQPCTSCSQTNADLEEEEPCTVASDTKCRCKKNHYCSSKECTICHPCKTCGVGGIKEDCTATSDRVCNDDGGAIAGIVVAVLAIGAIVAAGYVVVIRRKKQERKRLKENESESHVKIPLLPDHFNIEPLLPDIANEIGWNDMKNVALRTGMKSTAIESCVIDHQHSVEEQTLQLLMKFVQKESKEAPRKLIQTLERMSQKSKAENISSMLSELNSASSNNLNNN